jgi:hypothetical protein
MNIKTIIISVATFALIIAGTYFGAKFLYQVNKTELVVTTQPLDANITINGRRLDTNKIFLSPGKYLIAATKKGYFEYRKFYESGKENNQLSIKLNPIPEKYISKAELGSDFKKLAENYPIVNSLPYEDLLYTLDYFIYGSYTKGYRIEILVTALDAATRRMAIKEIKDLGFNPADYKIQFADFESEVK